MKKILSVILSVVFVLSSFTVMSFADDTVYYEQPFETGTMGSTTYRIPAIITLNNGSVLAVADMRYEHGSDSPQNIDTLVAISEDGYTDWEYTVVNHFDDYADGVSDSDSASFIDSAVVQSAETDRIFIITDAYMSGIGYQQTVKGTGYVEVDGEQCLSLTDGSNSYYLAAFEDGFATVMTSDGTATAYTVDAEYALYKDGEAIYTAQVGSDEMAQQNVFYTSSDIYLAVSTSYLWLRYSDDNGETWSDPVMLNTQVKSSKEGFLGVGPGKGFVTTVDGHERIIFCVYDTVTRENVSTIYSDDNGETWQRGDETSIRLGVGKTSEAQIVSLPDGSLRMYARNGSDYIAYADSTDGGVSWTKFKADMNLTARGNCMVSFINYSQEINGQSVILGSFASDPTSREDGVVVLGLVNDDNSVDWITTYHVTDGFFAYSCLTELADGNIGYLYEDEAAHISYSILTIGDDGSISEINGDNIEYDDSLSIWDKFVLFVRSTFYKILNVFNLL
ncbi:MAG: glycoside hydrolase [Clostridiales bacterium]|nr:glycoside hydrolase [Clostridiales bacterium]